MKAGDLLKLIVMTNHILLKKDEVDRAVILFKPMVSEPIHIHRKSPLPRSRKMATNEVSTGVGACLF